MSDWEVLQEPEIAPQLSQPRSSEWEMVNTPFKPKEPLSASYLLAAPRVYEDLARTGYEAFQKIPEYYEAAKTQVPSVFSAFKNDPFHAMGQQYAGLAEAGKNIFNTPHDFINYLTNRLNLVPENINRTVQMGRMPEEETQNAINETFGMPTQPGEDLLRGVYRNALNIAGAGGVASIANPLRYTAGGITKNVLKESEKQIASHTKKYDRIWNKAEKSGFNKVPVDKDILENDFKVIEAYKTPREYEGLKNFIENPTLRNAQVAQSDMGVISRALEEKSRTSSLLESEKSLFNAAKNAEKHIESNMFKNSSGQINHILQKDYQKLSKSYRKNVVPYRYNPHIQAYKAEEITAKELVNALSKGEFARKKGSSHPALGIRNFFTPSWNKVGVGGLLGLLYNSLMENQQSK